MDSKTRLIQASQDLRKIVYASLPWRVRLARALRQLKVGGTAEDFGRTAYGLFLLAGVTDMPETPFMPKNTREISRLPKGYGYDFGKSVEKLALSKLNGNKSNAEDILASVWVKMLGDDRIKNLISGKPLNEARNVIFAVVRNASLDFLKSKRNKNHDDFEDAAEELDSDGGSLEGLDQVLLEGEKEDIMRDLERVVNPRLVPDLPLYFQLLLDGYSSSEIVEKHLLPTDVSAVSLDRYRKEVQRVLEKHI
jgi:DNA-directed RNA polymerase specialized sigma24 family protein